MDNEKIDFSTFLDVPSVRKVRSYILKWRGRMKIGESPSKETSEKHSASMKEVWKKKERNLIERTKNFTPSPTWSKPGGRGRRTRKHLFYQALGWLSADKRAKKRRMPLPSVDSLVEKEGGR